MCYLAESDESSSADGQVDTEPVPASRLDDLRDDTTTGGYEPQSDDLNRQFLCTFKAVDATIRDDVSTPSSIETPDVEHTASDISFIDYA